LAANAGTISNGKGLVGKFQNLYVSEDDTLLFGECAGSGKNPYTCSVDFIDREHPVARCSCPSRQIPCKHAIGLLYAYIGNKKFEVNKIPDDILEKRGKIEKRAENKEKKIEAASSDAKPTKAKVNAAVKKIGVQLEGLAAAQTLLDNIVKTGIASVDAAALKGFSEQAKNLGNYHIGGVQTAFNEVLDNIKIKDNYSGTISCMVYMNALIKRARETLTKKRDGGNPLLLETDSAIEEQIGHIWKLEELVQYNRYLESEELVQLTFYSYGDDARREFVDEGYYISLSGGRVYKTVNYRPYKALKYVKEDDSNFGLIRASEVSIYPGDANPRIRFNKYTMEELTAAHFEKIVSMSGGDFASLQKSVKNQIRNALADKNPIYLLRVSDIITTGGYTHIVDGSGAKQLLLDTGYINTGSLALFRSIDKKLLIGGAVLVMFGNDTDSGLLAAKPLAAVTGGGVARFIY
jgi:hypothetical protein